MKDEIGIVTRKSVRSVDLAGPIGSDELAILLPETETPELSAKVFPARLQLQVAELDLPSKQEMRIGIGDVRTDEAITVLLLSTN